MLQHPVPEQHLKHIGNIAVSFSPLEFQIQSLIGSMLNERQRIGQIICAELSFRNLRALMISVFIERHGQEGEDFEELKTLLSLAGDVECRRNQIIYSIWGAGRDDNIRRIKATAQASAHLYTQLVHEMFVVDRDGVESVLTSNHCGTGRLCVSQAASRF